MSEPTLLTPLLIPPKNPISSTAIWGLFFAFVSWRIQKMVQNGSIPDFLAPLVGNAVFELVSYGISFGMILVGRWRAKQKLSLSAPVLPPTA